MSFLQPKIIPRGYIATPRKRLNSISEIGLKPALPNLPRPYVKRANIDPFEQHYVTPFIRMFDEEEAEKAKNRTLTEEQKAAAKYSIGNRIANATDHPLETLYNLVTLPTEITHALERKINTGNETARELKVIAAEDEDEENANYQDEKDKEISQIVDEISTFVRRTGGLPKWGIRKLQALKNKYFGGDDDVDVSSNLQAWNAEEERLQQEKALQQMQAQINSMFQQRGYEKRMDATKSVQALFKARAVQKEQERQQEATEALQGLLHGVNPQREFVAKNDSTQQLQGLLASKKQQKEYEAVQKAAENMQRLILARPKKVEKQRMKRLREIEEEREEKEEIERNKKWHDEMEEYPGIPKKRPPKDGMHPPPVLKKSRLVASDPFEQPLSFNVDLKQNERDVRKFLDAQQNRKLNRAIIPEPDSIMQAKLWIFLKNRKKPQSTKDLIPYVHPSNSMLDGFYRYNPTTNHLQVIPGVRNTPLPPPGKGYAYL